MRRARLLSVAALTALALTACGEPGSADGPSGEAPTGDGTATSDDGAAAPPACEPIAGEQLVALEDDQDLQSVENIIPAVHAPSAEPALIGALDAVSATLETQDLIELNQQVDVERNTSSQAAQSFYDEASVEIPDTSGEGTVVVGAANFSESATLAELYALALTDAGYTAEVRTIGNRETYVSALESGELTVVPEYVGTMTEFYNLQVNGSDAEPLASADLEATVEELTALGEQVGLTFGEPAEAANQNTFAVTSAFAEEHGVASLSELSDACGGIVLGGPPECPDRPFCQPGLEQTYGMDIAEFVSLDAGGPLTKQALTSGDIALGMVFSSDPALAAG